MAASVTPAPALIHVVVPGVGNHLGVTGDHMSRRSSHSQGWRPGGMGWHGTPSGKRVMGKAVLQENTQLGVLQEQPRGEGK